MPLIDVTGAGKVERIMRDTWGHLAPVPRHTYRGFILFGYSAFGDVLMLDYDFEGLDGNPWTHDTVSEFIDRQLDLRRFPKRFRSGELTVYRWTGTYTVAKNGAPRFSGKVRPQKIADRFPSPKPRRRAL